MQTESCLITAAKAEDVPAMAALLVELFGIEQDFSANLAKQIQGLHTLLANPDTGHILVARNAQQQVVGMVTAQLVISTAEGAYSAWLEDMIVAQPYRQQGLGKRLLQQMLDWARDKGATRAQLLVDMDNTLAVGYYDHLGWFSSRMSMRRILL